MFLLGLLAMGAAGAADEDAAVVHVNGTKNPDIHSYRSIVAGLDAFDAYHRLAPAVPEARFRLEARTDKETGTEPLSLRIVGDGDPIPLSFAADGSFTVPRNQAAFDSNADLVLNRRKGELEGRPDIHTPGLPANVRRLGDLRLECQIQVAIGKSELSLIQRAAINTLLLASDWCNIKNGQFWFQAPGLVNEAVIVEGARRAPIALQHTGYLAPIGNTGWSDDARIELQLEPELTAEEKAQPWTRPMYVMGSMNRWAPKARLLKVEDGVFKAALALPAGRHEFKIGGSNFVGVDLGGDAGTKQAVSADAPTALVQRGGNLVLNVDTAGQYGFLLDVRNNDKPLLTVTRNAAP